MDFTVIVLILLIVFVASVIRSAIGFGESLIAVPLLAFIIPIYEAVPLGVLLSITISSIVVVTDWEHIHVRSAKRLFFSTVFGLPFGFLVLKYGDGNIIKICLGIIIILFSLFSLWKKNISLPEKSHLTWLYASGFLAGVLGGAFGMNGPPLAVYGTLSGWSPKHFRATLHAYFLPASFLGALGYWNLGLLSSKIFHYYFLSLIVAIPAVFLGKKINHHIPVALFKKGVFITLMGIGLILMFANSSHVI
jgi:uncharacterized membrane protein YfcA